MTKILDATPFPSLSKVLKAHLIIALVILAGCKKTGVELHAEFKATVDGTTVTIENLSIGYDRVEWHFGDGNQSNEESPVYTYQSPGSYTIILRAWQANATRDYSQIVTVYDKVVEEEIEFRGPKMGPSTYTTWCTGSISPQSEGSTERRIVLQLELYADPELTIPVNGGLKEYNEEHRFRDGILKFQDYRDIRGSLTRLNPSTDYYVLLASIFQKRSDSPQVRLTSDVIHFKTKEAPTVTLINSSSDSESRIGLGVNKGTTICDELIKTFFNYYSDADMNHEIEPWGLHDDYENFYQPLTDTTYVHLLARYQYNTTLTDTLVPISCPYDFVSDNGYMHGTIVKKNLDDGIKLTLVRADLSDSIIVNLVNNDIDGNYKVQTESKDKSRNYIYFYSQYNDEINFSSSAGTIAMLEKHNGKTFLRFYARPDVEKLEFKIASKPGYIYSFNKFILRIE